MKKIILITIVFCFLSITFSTGLFSDSAFDAELSSNLERGETTSYLSHDRIIATGVTVATNSTLTISTTTGIGEIENVF